MLRRLATAAAFALLLAEPLVAGAPKPKAGLEWQDLFNGTDLAGFAMEGKGRWTVEDGCLVGRQDTATQGESWLFTEKEFTDFVLTLKFQMSPGGNSGVFLRVPKVQGHPAHIGYEMQIWDADPDYPTGSFYAVAKGTPGLQKADGWNEAQVVFIGSSLFTAINGHVALAINNRRRAYGRIGFQIHGGLTYKDTVVRFKDVRLAPVAAPPPAPKGDVAWKKIKLDDGISEGAAVFDVNRDGKMDILCGPQWYQNSTWKPYPVRKVPITADYAESFWELPCDVNADGYSDIIAGGAGSGKDEYWYENPRSSAKSWPPHPYMTRRGPIEGMLILDLDGDGTYSDLLPSGNGTIFNWIQIVPGPQPKAETHDLGRDGLGHGVGYGDVNDDGRLDILTPTGWYEAPENRLKGRWIWHGEFKLKGVPGVPIRTLDVNGDGKADIVWGNGHGYGLWWLEQAQDPQGKRTWTEHLIDDSFSQAQCIELGDINGDGRTDIVAGKRWRASNGADEGALEPTCLFWLEHEGKGQAWTRHVIDYNGGAGCGMGLRVFDVNGDGRLDVVAPGKGGLYLFLNQGTR